MILLVYYQVYITIDMIICIVDVIIKTLDTNKTYKEAFKYVLLDIFIVILQVLELVLL